MASSFSSKSSFSSASSSPSSASSSPSSASLAAFLLRFILVLFFFLPPPPMGMKPNNFVFGGERASAFVLKTVNSPVSELCGQERSIS